VIIINRARGRLVSSVRSTAALLGLLMFAGMARAQEFQNWNEVDFTASWKKIDFLLPAVVRTDANRPNPQFAATGIVASVPLLSHLQLVAGYLFADLPQSSQVAHVPLIAVAATAHKRRLTVLDQNRFEKLFNYGSEPVRYRNLLFGDVRFDHSQWHAFVDDEIFFNLSNSTWNQNRFQAGTGTRLNRRLSFDCYYLQRNARTGASPVHVLGTILTVKLTPVRTG
jgi:Protein of unknown function (DUF2490)